MAHVIRNYVSHANDAIESSHIGDENKFWIYKTSLLNFLDDSIAKEKTDYRKNQLMVQKAVLYLLIWISIKHDLKSLRNNHTGPAKVVWRYGLYIDIWAVGFTNHYIYVRGIRNAC